MRKVFVMQAAYFVHCCALFIIPGIYCFIPSRAAPVAWACRKLFLFFFFFLFYLLGRGEMEQWENWAVQKSICNVHTSLYLYFTTAWEKLVSADGFDSYFSFLFLCFLFPFFVLGPLVIPRTTYSVYSSNTSTYPG